MIKFTNFLNCQNGATAIEYALIATGIAMAVMVAVFAFGEDLSGLFDGLSAITSN